MSVKPMKFNHKLVEDIRQAASDAVKQSIDELYNEINLLIDSPKTGIVHTTYFMTDTVRTTPHQASSPGEPFASDSGYAQNHIVKHFNGQYESQILANYDYAWDREFGFVFPDAPPAGEPRPVFRPAIDNKSDDIIQIFKDRILKAIK